MNVSKKNLSLFLLFPLLLVSCKSKEKELSFDDEGRVKIHTKVQEAFLNDSLENVNLYARGKEELSRPLTPTFKWNDPSKSKTYKVYLSEYEDYSYPYTYEVSEAKVSFTNLKINTPYFFKVENNEGDLIHEESFLTSKEIIRNIYISGVTNARDLGGYKVGDTYLKQGLIYRTAKLNDDSKEEVSNRITSKGIKTMLEDLKVKSEIDLRLTSNNEVGGLSEGVGVLGESVKYFQCPMDFNSLDSEEGISSLKKIFSILGDKSNYPTFFHCSIGTDRTGYIAYLINAYLGVSEENLYRDYLFSNLGNIGGSRTISNIENKYVKDIKSSEGDTLSIKAKNYLLSKGVNESDLNVIKEMML